MLKALKITLFTLGVLYLVLIPLTGSLNVLILYEESYKGTEGIKELGEVEVIIYPDGYTKSWMSSIHPLFEVLNYSKNYETNVSFYTSKRDILKIEVLQGRVFIPEKNKTISVFLGSFDEERKKTKQLVIEETDLDAKESSSQDNMEKVSVWVAGNMGPPLKELSGTRVELKFKIRITTDEEVKVVDVSVPLEKESSRSILYQMPT